MNGGQMKNQLYVQSNSYNHQSVAEEFTLQDTFAALTLDAPVKEHGDKIEGPPKKVLDEEKVVTKAELNVENGAAPSADTASSTFSANLSPPEEEKQPQERNMDTKLLVRADTADSSESSSSACCPCCGKEAKLMCTRCRAQKYCSRDCQKTHWTTGHKKSCQTSDVITTRSVMDRMIFVDLEEEDESVPSDTMFILKIQVALSSTVSPMIAYNQSKSNLILINATNCPKSVLLDQTIRRYGAMGGAKCYFNAKIISCREVDHPAKKKLVIYLDQRQGNLPW